jgi:ABC-2 type transport system permease protein
VFYLLWKDFKDLFFNIKRIVVIFLVLIIFIIGTYYNITKLSKKEETPKIEFGVSDLDNSVYSKLLLEYFKESESFSSYIQIVEGNNEKIEDLFYQNELDLYIVIPEGFAENMLYLNHIPVKVMINTNDITKAIVLKNLLESYEKYISAVEINCVGLYDVMLLSGIGESLASKVNYDISYDLIFTALGKEKFFKYSEISGFPHTNLLTYYILSLITMIIIYTSLHVGFQILKEKRNGIFKRMHTIGIPTTVILFEKIVVSVFTLTIPLIVMLTISAVIIKEINLLKLFAFIFCGVIVCLTFFITFSGIFYRIQNYMMAGNLISFFWCIIGGGIIPIMFLPGNLVKLSKFTPNYWFMKIMLQIYNGILDDSYYKFIIGLLITSFLLYLIGVILYRREEVRIDE